MAHHHEHEHHHHYHHEHHTLPSQLNTAFKIGIILNVAYVLVEAVFGLVFNSMGLVSDAAHNLSDVVSLALAMMAFRLSGVASNPKYTYGFKKSTILISLLNALILCGAVLFIIVESIQKLLHPQPIEGGIISLVAAVGVLVNGFTAYLFLKDRKKDLNVKGAFLHMVADTLVSVGVILSGILIHFTGWYVIDAIIGLAVAVIIIFATWDLLKDSIRLALDGVPKQIHYDDVVEIFEHTDGVVGMHHMHIWAIGTTENALTAHVVTDDLQNMEQIKQTLKSKLKEKGIGHVTLEFETSDCGCSGLCEESDVHKDC